VSVEFVNRRADIQYQLYPLGCASVNMCVHQLMCASMCALMNMRASMYMRASVNVGTVLGYYVSGGKIRLSVRLFNTPGIGGDRTRVISVPTELLTCLLNYLQNRRGSSALTASFSSMGMSTQTIRWSVQYSEGRAGVQHQLYSSVL